jgi:hypothetical protein
LEGTSSKRPVFRKFENVAKQIPGSTPYQPHPSLWSSEVVGSGMTRSDTSVFLHFVDAGFLNAYFVHRLLDMHCGWVKLILQTATSVFSDQNIEKKQHSMKIGMFGQHGHIYSPTVHTFKCWLRNTASISMMWFSVRDSVGFCWSLINTPYLKYLDQLTTRTIPTSSLPKI